jgi:cytochrome c-type biogenesis protein
VAPVLLPLLAVVAGLVSFSSPCSLPLIPGYLSYVSALPVTDLGRQEARAVTLRAAVLFVAGFTSVFTLLGVSVGLAGGALERHLPLLVRISGVAIVAMGLATLGVLRVPFLYRERRLDLASLPRGPRAAFGFGMAFAFGWVPCVGQVLATILAFAAASRTAAWGAVLLMLYSVGLGLPFIVMALAYDRARGSLDWLRRHGRGIELAGGVVMVAVGVLFASGRWEGLFRPMQTWFARFGWPPI